MDKLRLSCHIPIDEATHFFETSGMADLSDLWTPKEIWETKLQALEQLIGQAPPSLASAGTRQS